MRKLSFLIVFFCFSFSVFAKSFSSRHFNVEFIEKTDVYKLFERISLNTANYEFHLSENKDIETALINNLDQIYLEVCAALDIHMESFMINLKVFSSRLSLGDALFSLYGKRMDALPSFYFFETNTIYISLEDITAGMFAHEVAHALISHYFVVPPPQRIQEILAGYAEYTIKKKNR